LADKAGVHRNTVTRAETDETEHGHAVAQMIRTLEAAGVEFTNGNQPGVRLQKQSFGRTAMPNEIRIGDHVMFLENRPAPDILSVGLVGQIVDPGYTPLSSSQVYVRFPNGREYWVDRGSLVHAPKLNRSEG
jgi:hypothetical protein